VVNPDVEVATLGHRLGEQPQLERGASQFAAQPRLGEVGLPHSDRDQFGRGIIEPFGHRRQGLGTDGTAGTPPPCSGMVRSDNRRLHLG
jgi:hypothetical protein